MQFLYAFYAVNNVKNHLAIALNVYNFKYYFSICFLVMCTALLCSGIYIYFLYNFIDHDLIIQYANFEYSKCLASSVCNISFEECLEIYQNNYFSIYGQFQAYVFSLIPCTLYSAIISLLMKINYK